MMMSSLLHPGLWLIFAGLCLPLLRGRTRMCFSLLVPLALLCWIMFLPTGALAEVGSAGIQLLRVDALAKLFLLVFCLTVFAGTLFACRHASALELAAAFVYAGSAMSVVLAGDLLTLFVFWEMMALASTLLIWSGGSKAAGAAGMRYVLIHLFGGVLLMAGIAGHYEQHQSLAFSAIGTEDIHDWLILAGFLLNAGAPPLSAWLADAYPESSFSGMVFLSAFTTKTAVYVLMRGFPGTEILIVLGLFMVFYGIIYALLENDMRRILAYSIVNQVGFMVCGVGVGTQMALNGAAAHAFTHIIYKALLLMSAGAVLHATGKRKCTELGGLVHSMPFTALCGVIGALAISSFPLTSGFVSKSMVVQAAVDERLLTVWLLLQAASAGVFLHAGIKFPWYVFFQKDSGMRPPEPPWNMCAAMGLFALLCVVLGCVPGWLYALLPWPVEYVPYTAAHVLAQLQLLLFSGLAFFLLLPWMRRTLTISLDFDWLYRRLLPHAGSWAGDWAEGLQRRSRATGKRFLRLLGNKRPGWAAGHDWSSAWARGISWGVCVLLLLFLASMLHYFVR